MFFLVLWVNAMHAAVDAQREQQSVAFAVEKESNAAAAGMHVFFCGTAHVSSAAVAVQAHSSSTLRCTETRIFMTHSCARARGHVHYRCIISGR